MYSPSQERVELYHHFLMAWFAMKQGHTFNLHVIHFIERCDNFTFPVLIFIGNYLRANFRRVKELLF